MSHNTAGYCEEPTVKTPLITDELFVMLAKPAVMQVWSRL
jgi:hypothetical protein